MKYFTNCNCIEDVKQVYKQLCLKWHPDIAKEDTTAVMQEINAEYEIAFAKWKNIHRAANGEEYTVDSTTEAPNEFSDVINKIISLQGIRIEIIGSWVWVFGNTYEHKEVLKNAGFRYCSNKKAWTWHKEDVCKKTRKTLSISEIKNIYGSQEVKTKYSPLLA